MILTKDQKMANQDLVNAFKKFDASFCINLDESIKRWNDVQPEFEKIGVHVERFSAIKPDNFIEGFRWPAEYGCYLSHMAVIQKAFDDGLDNVLVFEDDVMFLEGYEEVLVKALEELPEDWDMFFLGLRPEEDLEPFSNNLYKAHYFNCAQAYAVNKKTMKGLLDVKPEILDVLYGKYTKNHNVYTPNKLVCTQRPNFSYNQKRFVDFESAFETSWRKHAK